eukprot:CAMPEP_0206524736 /NCGR_PEP_ID=MMETSP0324_2-20121206/68344_1 /ASSEMBLY_ACC=CAM_ASM_000836 /TAXON_ID=2866 /ORGANISM="Crypthecodinium cohnii, Strain Seligo" /LENGTH=69 /DNA_ID=CAMNT_0054019325 /DNA_START=334 /DNA_END=543 /DNA_ORIENTATION=-
MIQISPDAIVVEALIYSAEFHRAAREVGNPMLGISNFVPTFEKGVHMIREGFVGVPEHDPTLFVGMCEG